MNESQTIRVRQELILNPTMSSLDTSAMTRSQLMNYYIPALMGQTKISHADEYAYFIQSQENEADRAVIVFFGL